MKVITIAGRSTKDCQVQEKEGRQFATFSVAVDDGFGPDKGVMFFDVTYHRAAVAQHITKGTRISVSGDLKMREYKGKTYLQVRASDLTLMGGGAPKQDRGDQPANDLPMDDEIPF